MASINGVKLKNVRRYPGHEGDALYFDIYVDGKKTATYSDDASGGMAMIDIVLTPAELEKSKDNTKKRVGLIEAKQKKLEERKDSYFSSSSAIYEDGRCYKDVLNDASDFERKLFDLEFFLLDVLHLKECESKFRKGLPKGYKCLGVVNQVCEMYQGIGVSSVAQFHVSAATIDGIHDSITKIDPVKVPAGKKSSIVIQHIYTSQDDFVVNTL